MKKKRVKRSNVSSTNEYKPTKEELKKVSDYMEKIKNEKENKNKLQP